MKNNKSVIAFHYVPGMTHKESELLIASLKKWGGNFTNYPLWIYEMSVEDPSKAKINPPPNASLFTIEIPTEIQSFPFASKIFLAADAETRAERMGVDELIWLDNDILFIQEPAELTLAPEEKIVLTPVQLLNISSLCSEPINDYWRLVYRLCGVPDASIYPVRTIVDQLNIRTHFNAGLLCLDPKAGILRKWKENFLSIYQNTELLPFYQQDKRYKIFIHQAVMTATILQICKPSEIKLLPANYNIPLQLLDRMDQAYLPASLDSLAIARYDDFEDRSWRNALPMSELYQKWLSEELNELDR